MRPYAATPAEVEVDEVAVGASDWAPASTPVIPAFCSVLGAYFAKPDVEGC